MDIKGIRVSSFQRQNTESSDEFITGQFFNQCPGHFAWIFLRSIAKQVQLVVFKLS